MIKLLSVTIFLLMAASYSFASDAADIGRNLSSAKAIGMGNSFVAVDRGVDSMSYNPAGISFIPSYEVMFMQTKILNTIDYRNFSGVLNTQAGVFGISVLQETTPAGYLTTDQGSMTNATPISYTSQFINISLGFSGNRLIKGSNMGQLGFGLTLKVIRNDFSGGNGNSTGVEGDAGILLMTPKGFGVGASIQNFMGSGQKSGSGFVDTLEQTVRYGISYKIPKLPVLISIAGENFTSGHYPQLITSGIEATPIKYLSLRAGLSQDPLSDSEVIPYITYGVGVNYGGISFDYAYKQRIEQSDIASQLFSISIKP